MIYFLITWTFYFSVKDKKSTPDRRGKEDTQEAWEDLGEVADGTVYPEGVLLASGIASINSLAFAGALPKNEQNMDSKLKAKGNLDIRVCYHVGNGNYFIYSCELRCSTNICRCFSSPHNVP